MRVIRKDMLHGKLEHILLLKIRKWLKNLRPILNLTPVKPSLKSAFSKPSSTIYDWTHADYIPHYKFPKGLRFKPSEVERWLRRRQKRGRENYQVEKIL